MFHLKEQQTSIKQEIIAGLTTFFTMVYIVVVNPVILANAGVPFDQVFTATIIAPLSERCGWPWQQIIRLLLRPAWA